MEGFFKRLEKERHARGNEGADNHPKHDGKAMIDTPPHFCERPFGKLQGFQLLKPGAAFFGDAGDGHEDAGHPGSGEMAFFNEVFGNFVGKTSERLASAGDGLKHADAKLAIGGRCFGFGFIHGLAPCFFEGIHGVYSIGMRFGVFRISKAMEYTPFF